MLRYDDNHFLHVTGDGERMLIATMTDNHLLNMIGYLCKAVKDLRDTPNLVGDDFTAGFYGVNKMDQYEAGSRARDVVVKAEPYIVEAVLRGLPVQQAVISLHGREGKIGNREDPKLDIRIAKSAPSEEE